MPEHIGPSRVVGILGGMGPAATVDFYDKLVRATPATQDQDHVRVVIWADPTVPNRHEALMAGGQDPRPWLEDGVQHLMRCGAEILVVPCNTIHAYMPAVVQGKDVEFISIIDVTVEAARQRDPTGRVGLLAADGALASGLYQSAFADESMELVLPSEVSQVALMKVIYSVKAGEAGPEERRSLASLLADLTGSGASTVIAGCTEVSVLLAQLEVDVRVIDPSQALAEKTVERARPVRT